MITRTFSLMPTFSESLFSDRLNRIDNLFTKLTGDEPLSALPSYDIVKIDETHLDIVIDLPGWSAEDIEILSQGGQLSISGKQKEEQENKRNTYLYRGLKRSNFNLGFSLPEHVKVKNANLKDGLLTVSLLQEIPENEKVQKIAIHYDEGNSTKAIGNK